MRWPSNSRKRSYMYENFLQLINIIYNFTISGFVLSFLEFISFILLCCVTLNAFAS